MSRAALVLVVDDFVDARELVAELLAHAGYRTLEAGDGPDALAKATAQRPDLVLLDLSLPGGMDGWQLARELRAAAPRERLRIVALTAHAGRQLHERALQAGCDDVLTKPCPPEALVARVRTHIGQVREGSSSA